MSTRPVPDMPHVESSIRLSAAAIVRDLDRLIGQRDAALRALTAVGALAEEWATQPTDYDEDTEQQIEDGEAILAVLADMAPEEVP